MEGVKWSPQLWAKLYEEYNFPFDVLNIISLYIPTSQIFHWKEYSLKTAVAVSTSPWRNNSQRSVRWVAQVIIVSLLPKICWKLLARKTLNAMISMPTKTGTKYKSRPANPDHQTNKPKINQLFPRLSLFPQNSISLNLFTTKFSLLITFYHSVFSSTHLNNSGLPPWIDNSKIKIHS